MLDAFKRIYDAFGARRLMWGTSVFRVLKLVQYVGEADHLAQALRASRRKIIVFGSTRA